VESRGLAVCGTNLNETRLIGLPYLQTLTVFGQCMKFVNRRTK